MGDIKTDREELKPYLAAGWQLIPLHHYTDVDSFKGKPRFRGKSPKDNNWTKRLYESKDQFKHMEKGGNVGVRLRVDDLVIDVDPRNFKDGDDPFKRLCEDCSINPDDYPVVVTGSGGLHVYMKKPGDISVRDSMPDYEGVEFKTIGRQVVSAGSIHPEAKKLYLWEFLNPELKDAIQAPKLLLNIIKRPEATKATGGGEHDQDELAKMLDALDTDDFREHDRWLTLMQACHHATNGDGRNEFVEWSTRDPEYADDGHIIGRRWDSLHADNTDGARITFRTLHKFLRDADKEELIPRRAAADDFDAVTPEDLPIGKDGKPFNPHEQKGPLEKMNEEVVAVMEGSKFRIYWEEEDLDFRNDKEGVTSRKTWRKADLYNFKNFMANRKVEVPGKKGKSKAIPLVDAWMEWSGRRTYKGVIFNPERDQKDYLNLWTGWSYIPQKSAGSWDYLQDLMFEVLSDGDDKVFKYIMDWCAYYVQHPASPAEVAICFQGGKGVGKGTLGRALVNLAGKHGMPIASAEQITGRFNDHLRDTIFLFADEAISPYDKKGESRLKELITEPYISYEGKGKDVLAGKNMLHIMMAGNEQALIPAGLDGERRFMMQKANNRRAGQHGFFEKLHAELNGGGYQRMLWDLLARDIEGWAPRKDIPITDAIAEQKLRNMSSMQQWWFDLLDRGELPCEPTKEDLDWHTDEVRLFKCEVKESYRLFCKDLGIKYGTMGKNIEYIFVKELRILLPYIYEKAQEVVPEDRQFEVEPMKSNGRQWAYGIPPLKECRAHMEKLLGKKFDWTQTLE